MRSAAVVRYRDLRDAGSKLQILSNPSSPLLALFYTASHNTAVANPDIAKEFQPTQVLASPDSPDRLMNDKNTSYINGLVGLQGAVSQVAADPNAATTPGAFQPVITAAISAHGAVSQTAQAFNIDPQAHIEQTVLALLQAPITSAEDIAKPGPPKGGGLLCQPYAFACQISRFRLWRPSKQARLRFPAFFQPGSGALWQFYDASLKPLRDPAGIHVCCRAECTAQGQPSVPAVL